MTMMLRDCFQPPVFLTDFESFQADSREISQDCLVFQFKKDTRCITHVAIFCDFSIDTDAVVFRVYDSSQLPYTDDQNAPRPREWRIRRSDFKESAFVVLKPNPSYLGLLGGRLSIVNKYLMSRIDNQKNFPNISGLDDKLFNLFGQYAIVPSFVDFEHDGGNFQRFSCMGFVGYYLRKLIELEEPILDSIFDDDPHRLPYTMIGDFQTDFPWSDLVFRHRALQRYLISGRHFTNDEVNEQLPVFLPGYLYHLIINGEDAALTHQCRCTPA